MKNGWWRATPCTWNFGPNWCHFSKKLPIFNQYSLLQPTCVTVVWTDFGVNHSLLYSLFAVENSDSCVWSLTYLLAASLLAATAFDCIYGTGPAYFKHVCTPASDISGRAHLRYAECRDMLVPRTRTELGRRSFSFAALTVWNSLPAHLCSTLISRRQFRDGLKSHLFADAYFWSSENIRYKSVMYLLSYLLTCHM